MCTQNHVTYRDLAIFVRTYVFTNIVKYHDDCFCVLMNLIYGWLSLGLLCTSFRCPFMNLTPAAPKTFIYCLHWGSRGIQSRKILHYKIISRGFPDERDCLYYMLMGLNSIPDKERAGAEKERAWEQIQTKIMWWLSQRAEMMANIYMHFQISLFNAMFSLYVHCIAMFS